MVEAVIGVPWRLADGRAEKKSEWSRCRRHQCHLKLCEFQSERITKQDTEAESVWGGTQSRMERDLKRIQTNVATIEGSLKATPQGAHCVESSK